MLAETPKLEAQKKEQLPESNPIAQPKQEDTAPQTAIPKTEISIPTQIPTQKEEKITDTNLNTPTLPTTPSTNYDTNGNGRVTCDDFTYKVTDPKILALYPDLDRDNDGIGCESKK